MYVGSYSLLAAVGRPVRRFVDFDVRHPIQDALDRDTALHSGERSAGARVHAAGKGHVLADILAVDLELVRILEAAWIPIGGAG